MTLSVRLKPELARLLDRAARRQRKPRSAVVHEALAQYLVPARPRLGDVIRDLLADSPQGLGIERLSTAKSERRAKLR